MIHSTALLENSSPTLLPARWGTTPWDARGLEEGLEEFGQNPLSTHSLIKHCYCQKATGCHKSSTQVSLHTHTSFETFSPLFFPSRGTSSTSQEELNKVMVFYSTETSRLHRTLLKQPMAGPRGKASNKESLSSAEGSWREQRFASDAAEGLSPPPVRKVLVFFGVMGGKHEGIQRFRGIHEAQSAGWSFQGRALQPIVQHWVLEH